MGETPVSELEQSALGQAVPEVSEEPAQAEVSETSLALQALGLHTARLRASDEARLGAEFRARADAVLTGATLHVSLTKPLSRKVEAIEVTLNGDSVATIAMSDLDSGVHHRRFELDATSLGDRNYINFQLVGKGGQPLQRVAPGTWLLLRGGRLTLQSVHLSLPVGLEQLPLPFLDGDFQQQQVLNFVFAEASPALVQAAGVAAGWFALQGGERVSFATQLGALPAGADALVFAVGTAQLQALGLEGLQWGQPTLAVLAHPKDAQRRLLVFYAPTEAGLQAVANGLVRYGYELSGTARSFAEPVPLPELKQGQVPRWAAGRTIALGDLPGAPTLRLDGGHAGDLVIGFRLRPDLFVWPRDKLYVRLKYQQGGSEQALARVHVMFNEQSLGTLPSGRQGERRFAVSADLLRGFNELVLQVSYPPGVLLGDGEPVYVEVLPDSRIEFAQAPQHFLSWPDLRTFVEDGFPFTAVANLSETVVWLPGQPATGELSALLSQLAYFATITGYVPSGPTVLFGASQSKVLAGRDLLVVGAAGRHPMFEQFPDVLPVKLHQDQAVLRKLGLEALAERWLEGRFRTTEFERARLALSEQGPYGAVIGVASPYDPARALLVITGSESSAVPEVADIRGFADAAARRNDVLLVRGGKRAFFSLGGIQGRGDLPWSIALRFWFAQHWPLLVLVLLGAALSFAVFAFRGLGGLARDRLGVGRSTP